MLALVYTAIRRQNQTDSDWRNIKMSTSYLWGITVGVIVGVIIVALIFTYNKKKTGSVAYPQYESRMLVCQNNIHQNMNAFVLLYYLKKLDKDQLALLLLLSM